jgi:tetratricopeptide (TPR) repeat protein
VEQRALEAHLAVCDLCRAAGAFAALYDAIPDGASAGDDVLIARLAERVAASPAAPRRRRQPRLLALAAGLAVLVVAGSAAAWIAVRGFSRALDNRAAAPLESRTHRNASELAAASGPLDETTEREAAVRPTASDETPARHDGPMLRHAGVGARGKAPRTSLATAAGTAAQLFAEANAARRALDLRRATELYLALEGRFPESAEARVALVSAGDLLSRLGDPTAALHAFDRYLERWLDGALAPEALFGRARALRQLGRRQDEVDAWRRLLRAFPGSIYESGGRQRLGELLR